MSTQTPLCICDIQRIENWISHVGSNLSKQGWQQATLLTAPSCWLWLYIFRNIGVYVYGKHLTITGIFTCVEHCSVCMCESMGAIFTCVFGEVYMGVWVYRSCVWQKCCECKRLSVWNSGMSWLTWHSQTWQAYQHQPNSLGSTHPCTCNSHSFPWPSLCPAHCWNHLACGYGPICPNCHCYHWRHSLWIINPV